MKNISKITYDAVIIGEIKKNKENLKRKDLLTIKKMTNRINKIKNYNQILLAIAGTFALLLLLVSGIIIISNELRPCFGGVDEHEEGIITNVGVDALMADSLRKQIISFSNIHLIDSANKMYILPVRQANISGGESTSDLLGLTNMFTSGGRGKYYGDYYGNGNVVFNNIVLYESIKNESSIIFKNRISIRGYNVVKKEKEKFILIIGTDNDSNVDYLLNREDLQELYIYAVGRKELTKVKTKEKFTTLNIFEHDKTKDVIGKFGLDRNGNGEFDYGKEPMVFYKIDLESKSLIKIIQDGQIDELQKLLEGG